MKTIKLFLLLVGVSISLAASAQKFRDNPEQVLSDEFGWTIKDLTRLSGDSGGLFSARKEPFQGFKCETESRYLPRTDEQKKAWRIGSSVCRTFDRKRNENIGAFLVLSWGNLGVEKPATIEDFIDDRGKLMSGDSAKEGYSYKIVESKTVNNIRIDLIEYQLPFSTRPFCGPAASFDHRGFRYILLAANASTSDTATKKPWEVIEDIANRVVIANGP